MEVYPFLDLKLCIIFDDPPYLQFLTSRISLTYPPPRKKGLMFGLLKENQWVFISPDHKAGYFWGGWVGTWYVALKGGGKGWLTSHGFLKMVVPLQDDFDPH